MDHWVLWMEIGSQAAALAAASAMAVWGYRRLRRKQLTGLILRRVNEY